ncbi:uncharacterized protein Z520_04903 [Fonsecaea multimorphosa CBS 102226]|uniref:Uncharacterized protein n=1 Tax=Fonsecaea multimorphosa CBS 102226 TaxID=1442371 RepID=A0A0D2K0I4_9EURO|nr:uncharacterized protein Z520_04903 [Fonsecaea multimorphosa CBS 102226]KIX99327.1 hypothetical protein Z520_04903 [Fonsecaea multimorphosa CBS 102226]OAL25657.1 hypothetical protein AYO22_04646 [Fonsecaea multimorphosa]
MASQDASCEQTHPPPQPDLDAIYTHLSRYPFSTDPEYQAGLATILGHQHTPPTPEELHEKSDLVLQAQCFYFSRKFHIMPPVAPQAYSAWLQSQPQPHPHLQLLQSHSDEPEEPATSAPPPATSSAPSSQPRDPPQTTASASASTSANTTTIAAAAPSEAAAQDPPPPYPTSFAAIVDLITRNLPVPGIEEIPPTVLEPGSSKVDRTPRRKKPWEKDVDDVTTPSGGEQQSQAEGTTSLGFAGDTHATTSGGEAGSKQPEGVVDVNGHKVAGDGLVKILQPNAIPDSGLLSRD